MIIKEKHTKPLPTKEEIEARLSYDPISGVFRWLKLPGARTASPAGTKSTPYVFIKFGKFGFLGAHRLAWIVSKGPIPKGLEVDHIDLNPRNNAITNLRLATNSQQRMNQGVQSNNRSGLKGAYYHACHKGKKWRSQIKTPNDGLVFLGYFHTAQEAHDAYAIAVVKYHGEFARAA